MRPFVVIATKGRAGEVLRLMDYLSRQTLPPVFTIVAGTEASDIYGLHDHPWIKSGNAEALVSLRIGSSAQRNFGIDTLEQRGFFLPEKGRFFVTFFDDDFLIADDWLEKARDRLLNGDVAGLCGWVLADGVRTGLTGHYFVGGGVVGHLTEEIAIEFLLGNRSPLPHWAGGEKEKNIPGAYGCNMAFTDEVILTTRFDENVPLYGWLEDRDLSWSARKYGRVIYCPLCRGVHLGAKDGGRTNGLRFGYSQIANPLYFANKGTIPLKDSIGLVLRGLVSNAVHSLLDNPVTDYRGRLRGNLTALVDVLRRRMNPKRILDL